MAEQNKKKPQNDGQSYQTSKDTAKSTSGVSDEQRANETAASHAGSGHDAGGYAAPEQNRTKKAGYALLLVAVIVILALVAAFFMWRSGSDGMGGLGLDQQSGESQYPEVVARVNGEEVTSTDLTQSISQTEQVASQQGMDLNDAQVKEQIESQALTVAINSVLLIQAADGAGITASEDDVSQQIASLEEQFGGAEQFQQQIDSMGLSQEQLRQDIREQLKVDAYIQQSEEVANISTTEEEVRTAYDRMAEQGQELPPFEEVSAQIEQQLLAQKRQQATGAIIERLRAEAEIETLI